MKKIVFSIFIFVLMVTAVDAQKYFTRGGQITFFSDTPIEKIEAQNTSANSVFDLESGRMEFAVLIKAFHFEKALMQEHFNENYMDSSKFPKATFKGSVSDASKLNFSKDGTYPVKVKGDLTIHGETQTVETDGTFEVKDGNITATSSFVVLVADYGIEIPKVVRENIAKEVRIDVAVDLKELKR